MPAIFRGESLARVSDNLDALCTYIIIWRISFGPLRVEASQLNSMAVALET